jgi:tetratricopeptide (TPR) repeat protein
MTAKKKTPVSEQEDVATRYESMLEENWEKSRPFLLPAGIVMLIIFGVMLMNIRGVEQERAHNADAYALLQQAADLDDPAVTDDAELKEIELQKQKVYKDVLDKFAETSAAMDAKYLDAKAEFAIGNYEVAAKKFADFAATNPDQQPQAGMARIAEATSYLQSGDTEKAYTTFAAAGDDAALQTANPQAAVWAQYKAGVCAMILGNYDKAKVHLESVLADTEVESLRSDTKDLLSRLKIITPEALKASLVPPPPEPEPKKEDETPKDGDKPAEGEEAKSGEESSENTAAKTEEKGAVKAEAKSE